MRRCEVCCREFTGCSADCPFCGFNNASRGGPRSLRSLAEMERRRREQEEFERELSELSEEFRLWLGWNDRAEEEHAERILHDC